MNKLRNFLAINSIFSALSGLIMLVFSTLLNRFFNIEHPYIFPFIGANLLLFSMFVTYVAQKDLNNKLLVNIISALDGLWVLGSLAIIVFGAFNLSTNGYIAIAAVAVWIAYLGWNQYKNNK